MLLFEVIDPRTGGAPIFDFNHVFREKWFKNSSLIYCDIAGWCIDEEGNLFLIDDCDNIAYPPAGRFRVVYNLRKLRAINYGEEV